VLDVERRNLTSAKPSRIASVYWFAIIRFASRELCGAVRRWALLRVEVRGLDLPSSLMGTRGERGRWYRHGQHDPEPLGRAEIVIVLDSPGASGLWPGRHRSRTVAHAADFAGGTGVGDRISCFSGWPCRAAPKFHPRSSARGGAPQLFRRAACPEGGTRCAMLFYKGHFIGFLI
jgi:hypothetical protein